MTIVDAQRAAESKPERQPVLVPALVLILMGSWLLVELTALTLTLASFF